MAIWVRPVNGIIDHNLLYDTDLHVMVQDLISVPVMDYVVQQPNSMTLMLGVVAVTITDVNFTQKLQRLGVENGNCFHIP